MLAALVEDLWHRCDGSRCDVLWSTGTFHQTGVSPLELAVGPIVSGTPKTHPLCQTAHFYSEFFVAESFPVKILKRSFPLWPRTDWKWSLLYRTWKILHKSKPLRDMLVCHGRKAKWLRATFIHLTWERIRVITGGTATLNWWAQGIFLFGKSIQVFPWESGFNIFLPL